MTDRLFQPVWPWLMSSMTATEASLRRDRASRGQLAFLGLLLAAGVTLSVTLFLAVRAWENRQLWQRFVAIAQERHAALQSALDLTATTSHYCAALFETGSEVTREEFGDFAAVAFARDLALTQIAWLPRGSTSNQPLELAFVESETRAGRAPVEFALPLEWLTRVANEDTSLRPFARFSSRPGAVNASAIQLVHPVSRAGPNHREGQRLQSRDPMLGFVWMEMDTGRLLEAALRKSPPVGMDLTLRDPSGASGSDALYAHRSRLNLGARAPDQPGSAKLEWAGTLRLADRTIQLVCEAAPAFYQESSHRNAWRVLVLGLTFTGALGAYSFNAQRRASEVRSLIASLSQEVQERRDAESASRASEQALRESEARYRLLVEHAPDAIVTLDPQGRFTSSNPYAEAISGWALEEWLHKPFLPLVHPDDLPLAQKVFATALAGGKPPMTEVRVHAKSGEILPMEFTVAPWFQGDQVGGVLTIGRDISGRRKAEQAQARLQAQLRQAQKMEALGTLAGGIAHDFNNVLAAIISHAELVKMDLAPDHPGVESLDQISRACDRAAGMVRQILAFSRKQEQARQPLHLETLVKEVLKMVRATLPATIEITQALDSACPAILGDPAQIHQILLNLVTNAAHAMRDRGGVLEVSVNLLQVDEEMAARQPELRAGPYVCLSVNDSGHGMDSATLERIFEPFFTTKVQGEGTGLGLSVVHGIVKSHEGAISVYSEPGRGTSFQVYFPIIESEFSIAHAPRVEMPRGQGQRILFVDDEPMLASGGQRILERLGYHAVVCTSAVEALTKLSARGANFACVVTDLTMPRMTGLELARMSQRLQPNVPVVLTTGYSGALTVESLRSYGIRELIQKPVTPRALAETLERLLNRPPQS